ncbi:response regulator transcription factor [Priestia aryabhattai]|uniref:response regulator transcription factor n=1 Tax=Priestia aryabhattai TaxID=412384 RepID=UPI003981C8CC
MIKVLIVDDHVLIRRGLVLLLESYNDIQIIGEASTGDEAILFAERNSLDVVLMDISMPKGLDGFTAAEEILKLNRNFKIILLSMHDEEVYVQKAIEINAHGYILKKSQGGELYDSITTVYNGGIYYKVGIPNDQIKRMFKKQNSQNSILSMREKEIIRLTILGFTNKQMSKKLMISPKTVENHKANIMKKLDFKDKSDMIQYGINNKYIEM